MASTRQPKPARDFDPDPLNDANAHTNTQAGGRQSATAAELRQLRGQVASLQPLHRLAWLGQPARLQRTIAMGVGVGIIIGGFLLLIVAAVLGVVLQAVFAGGAA